METKVKQMIDEIRPVLNSDGGDIMLVGVYDNVVMICMTGCVCRLEAIEKYLKKRIPEVKKVVNIADSLEKNNQNISLNL